MSYHRRPLTERAARGLAWVFFGEVLLLGMLMVINGGAA